ncbi:MAG: phytanoyl-CoA dioxygenase family protein [Capsulimonadales bacterium]|nr:phytanoyl-CoA dioxygenase family protein [Capsulimonadales bacterium]
MFRRTFRIRSNRVDRDPPRVIDVLATPEEVARLETDGFLVRPGIVHGEMLAELRQAADELEAETLVRQKPGEGKGFGGLFIRNIVDKHPVFLKWLLRYEPSLSVARALLGPQLQLHASVLRVAYPQLENQDVEWHFHQRVVPDWVEDGVSRGEPPWFALPVVMDNLLYLDELTEETGPLVVLPGTHRVNADLPSGDFSEKPGQVLVTCPAGSIIMSHTGLWHRALAPKPSAPKRRLLIFGYSPVWMKPIDKPSAGAGRGLTDTLLPTDDEETRELLGLTGYY